MGTIFISHSSQDKKFVRRLAMDLVQRGFEVWYDDWQLDAGARLSESIEKGIGTSAFVVVVLSEAMLTSSWVARETQQAIELETRDGREIVIPVRIDDADIPAALRDRVYADFAGGLYLEPLERLCDQLRRALQKDQATRSFDRELIPLFIDDGVDLDVAQLEDRVRQLAEDHGSDHTVQSEQLRLPDEPEVAELRRRLGRRVENIRSDPYYSPELALDIRRRYAFVRSAETALLNSMATVITMRGIRGGRFAFAGESYRWLWRLARTEIIGILYASQSPGEDVCEFGREHSALYGGNHWTSRVYGVTRTPAPLHVINPKSRRTYSVNVDPDLNFVREFDEAYYEPIRLGGIGEIDFLAKWVIPQAFVTGDGFDDWDAVDTLLVGVR